MIKFYHELTKRQTDIALKKASKAGQTYEQFASDYPQPKWCAYPEATQGVMGCWSLFYNMVTGEDYCKKCDCYIKPKRKVKEVHCGK